MRIEVGESLLDQLEGQRECLLQRPRTVHQLTAILAAGQTIVKKVGQRSILVGRGGGGAERHPHSSLRALVYNPDNRSEAKLSNFQGWRTSFFNPQLNQLIEQAERERCVGVVAQALFHRCAVRRGPRLLALDHVVLQQGLQRGHLLERG